VYAPLEPGKPEHRVTLVAAVGEKVAVSTYPWINGLEEDAIARALQPREEEKTPTTTESQTGTGRRGTAVRLVNGVLRTTLGVELQRVTRPR
jgi:hypothetical protein